MGQGQDRGLDLLPLPDILAMAHPSVLLRDAGSAPDIVV